MAKDCSFDVVSEVDMQELDNAVNQTMKEVNQRYDFKGSRAQLVVEKDSLKLTAEDDYKLGAMLDILRTKMVKRNVPLKCLSLGKIETSSGNTVKQIVTIQKGISKEKAKEITAAIKNTKLRVQAQMMDEQLRITGAKKDDLQAVMQALREVDLEIDLQFINFRS
jgi:uncharacterized protein YajQ (UPF0234 family)